MATETETRLKKARELRGLSQAEAARRSKVSQTYWTTLERGENNPTINKAHRIARALGFKAEELWPPDPPQRSAR
jgi:transcriptional regulator with XRE-family HTH domain